jgi:PAS domain S-box-containing protein
MKALPDRLLRDQDSVVRPVTETILESISDGVFTIDRNWMITSFNRAAEEITGVPREEAIGRRCAEVFRSNRCEGACALRETLEHGQPVVCRPAWIVDAEGNRIPVSVSTAVLKDAQGSVIGGVETFRDLTEIETLRQELEGKYRIGDLCSRSQVMQRIFEVLPAIAASPSTVMVLGETGTGKERIARTLHALSPRASGPFVAVNCGALPDTLLESELFGYKAGAFTGAIKDKPGRFAMAKGGTLFLDEIGEISQALQVRLLRVLQDHCYEPLGATQTEKADVRVIVATHRNLAQQVTERKFRDDLYYRINVIQVELPPLRERKEDIPLLALQFVERFNTLQQRKVQGVSPKTMALLMAHDWPGNIRELENVIERAFILCQNGSIEPAHLPAELAIVCQKEEVSGKKLSSAREMLDRQAIMAALERNRYKRIDTANELGMHKTTLYRKMKKLGIPFRPKRERGDFV